MAGVDERQAVVSEGKTRVISDTRPMESPSLSKREVIKVVFVLKGRKLRFNPVELRASGDTGIEKGTEFGGRKRRDDGIALEFFVVVFPLKLIENDPHCSTSVRLSRKKLERTTCGPKARKPRIKTKTNIGTNEEKRVK